MSPAIISLWLGGAIKSSYIMATWKWDLMVFSGEKRRAVATENKVKT